MPSLFFWSLDKLANDPMSASSGNCTIWWSKETTDCDLLSAPHSVTPSWKESHSLLLLPSPEKKKNSFTSESLDWSSFVCFGSMWVSGLMASVLQGSKQSSLVPVSRWWGYRAHRPSHWLLCLRSSQVRGWEALQPKKVICVANQQNPTTRKVRKDHTDLGSCRQKNKAKFGHSSAASLWAHRLAVCTEQAEVNRPREE